MSHGTQTCSACGGYLQPLKDMAEQVWFKCRSCGDVAAVSKKNTERDFINATAYDYDEN